MKPKASNISKQRLEQRLNNNDNLISSIEQMLVFTNDG